MHGHPKKKILYKMYEALVGYNDHNDAPFYNEKLQKVIHNLIAEEESDDHKINLDDLNVNVDNSCKTPVTPNTQGENSNAILTSERINNLDTLTEILKGLTIKNAVYYESEKITQKAILPAIQR